jgi:hypothetical protein
MHSSLAVIMIAKRYDDVMRMQDPDEIEEMRRAEPKTDKPSERKPHSYSPTLTTRVVLRQLWDDEREIVELMARLRGLTPDQFTVQDVNLILAQARHDGDLAERYEDEADK